MSEETNNPEELAAIREAERIINEEKKNRRLLSDSGWEAKLKPEEPDFRERWIEQTRKEAVEQGFKTEFQQYYALLKTSYDAICALIYFTDLDTDGLKIQNVTGRDTARNLYIMRQLGIEGYQACIESIRDIFEISPGEIMKPELVSDREMKECLVSFLTFLNMFRLNKQFGFTTLLLKKSDITMLLRATMQKITFIDVSTIKATKPDGFPEV